MKTKLLKKLRKRFLWYYKPNLHYSFVVVDTKKKTRESFSTSANAAKYMAVEAKLLTAALRDKKSCDYARELNLQNKWKNAARS